MYGVIVMVILEQVAVNIKNLREKIDPNNKYIITIWGYGYKFVRN